MRRPLFVATTLFAATLLSRLPFVSQQLWAWDSVLYARALEGGFHVDYSLAGQRPHPPGYLLYVATSALAREITQESNDALVLVSVVASALAVAGLFLLARRFASDGAAALVAAGFALNPLVWHYSEVAYPYTLLALLSIVLAAGLVAARGRGAAAAVVAGAAFGAAAGFRQDLLLILGPLWLWSVAALRWRARAAAAVSVCVGCLVWLVPTALLSGGAAAYAEALTSQTDYVRATYSIFAQGLPALVVNLGTTAYALAWGLGLFALPMLAVVVAGVRHAVRIRRLALARRGAVLFTWAAPALVLYVVLHIGEWGYVLSVLPTLYVVAALGIDRAVRLPRVYPRAAMAAATCVAGVMFLFTSAPFSAAAIGRHDAELAARVRYVREHYSPQKTLMLAREDFLLVRYYLPEYRAWFHDPDPFHSTLRRKRVPQVTAIVVFTPGLRTTSASARRVECAKGVQLVYLAIEPGAVVELYGERYTVAESLR